MWEQLFQRILSIDDVRWSSVESMQRVCIHNDEKGLQTMLIRMPAYFTYEFIKDQVDGQISFHVVDGCLEVTTLVEERKRQYKMSRGDTLYLDRRIYRKTATENGPCIYLENISGGFHKDARVELIPTI